MRAHPEAQTGLASLRPLVVALGALGAAALGGPRAPAAPPDRLQRPGGPRVEGRLQFDPGTGFRFEAVGEPSQARPVGPGGVVEFAPGPAAPASIPPLFQAGMGESGRISGALRAVSEGAATLAVPWQAEPVSIRRPGVQWLVQRLGEARVLADGFDSLDPAWGVVGRPRAVVEGGETALLLPPVGASIERRFGEPIDAGRVDLTFRDDGAVRPGRRWTLELTFRAPGGPAGVRVLLGWAEESLAVESPEGPSLAVQRLARTDAWRRLSVRFGRDRTEIAVDGDELAHGRGPAGPLESIRIATAGEPADAEGPGGYVGEVQVARFAQVPSSLEIDPSQDEARLVVGDQLFGAVRGGDRDRVAMLVDDRPVALDWADLAGIYFRRDPAPGAPVSGALARVEWRAGDGPDGPTDFAEGAVAALSDEALTLDTPYAGTLRIPRDRLASLRVLEPGLRLSIDPCAHHLGDEVSTTPPLLDPPMPEGGVLERTVEIPAEALAAGPAFAVLDVLGVVGSATGLPFSDYVRRGELKTYLVVNGKRVDDLNRHVPDANEAPRRIRVPIPADALRPGGNSLRIEQTGIADDPEWFDDLGILGVAVEFAAPPREGDPPAAASSPAPDPDPPRP